ncbi:MAG: amino acid adenylation domain-containing protein [Deltaproteobacteria bacterium]|nr:amino acid adenylation domain-containing protein [Deltaproteobacteria bacterium]
MASLFPKTPDRARLARMLKEGDFPLSFAQQRLWFLDQLEPGSSAYTITAWQRFSGLLDLPALTNAFTELVRRHESLRTTFVRKDGEPVQRIADPVPATLTRIDLESLPPADRAEAARRIIHEQAQQGFDLTRGPLFRPVLIRLSPEEHELLIAVHHIVADGWSINILVQELMTLYEAGQTGQPLLLPELPLQYADFALWQRQRLTGETLESLRQYWRTQMGGDITPLELPTDHLRSHRSMTAGATHEFVLPLPLADRLRALSRHEGTTLFMTLLAAFQALLARYTDQEDIVVGSPVANRHHVELESIVGFFANTLALRTNLGGDPTFRELLARVRETCLGAYTHQDLPFEKLVEELNPERPLGQNPLFQISFAWQEATTGADLASVTVASPFDLTFFMRDRSDGTVQATARYRPDLFEPGTIARFVNHYCTLIEGMAADPDCRLSALPLLNETDTHQLLIEYNATATHYPREHSIHHLFEDQVDATPDALALVAEGTALTYRELDLRANRLAHYLHTLGIGPERIVGVWMERSVDAIIAMLGILKAGGAYAPFDLSAPPERVAVMVSDAKVEILLTHERLRTRLPEPGLRTLCLDMEVNDIERQPNTRLGVSVDGEGLAYVMYTSGSTGAPKGIAVTHRGVVRLVKNTNYAHFGPDEILLQLAALSFDAATLEIWGALLNGARLAVAPPGVLSLEELGTTLTRYGVTTLWLTAGLFHHIVDHRLDILGSLRQLLVGGDVLSPLHVQRVLAALPSCRLINGYGPTEGTTFTCCHTTTSVTAQRRTVPIGRPIANTRVYILDRSLRPVPIGVPGELWIAGDGLARGYLNRPALTEERFLTQRFSETLLERLYRSGDRVRWLDSGELEFLGRLDNQVKVRGFRVELGEIESTLGRHPHVREVVVMARPARDGDKHLVAYVVANGAIDAHDLRTFLGRTLPDYMMPTAFVALDRLPLTANGKVDRHALPEPEAPTGILTSCVEPRDELEQQLVTIWRDVLAVDSIGTSDNFFALGGHSLLALRMFVKMEEQLHVTLPLATLFQAPTVAGLAAFIREGRQPTPGRSLVPIQQTGNRPPVFGVPGVGGNVLSYHALARFMGPDQPFYGLQSRGLDGMMTPLTRIEDIAAGFLREMRAVQPEGPYYLMGACMGGVVAYEMAQQLRSIGQEVGLLILLETWPPMKTTSTGPPKIGHRMPAMVGFVADRLRLYADTLARLSFRERLRYVRGRVKLLAEMIARRDVLREARGEFNLRIVTQANLQAFQQYGLQPYPGPVILFRAEGRQVAPENDYRLAWRHLITGELEIAHVPGDNSGQMLIAPHVQELALQIQTCLNRAQAVTSPRRQSNA